MAVFSRHPREHWLKPHFSKNEVANSGNVPAVVLAAPKVCYNTTFGRVPGFQR